MIRPMSAPWFTYQEAAAHLGIKPESVKRRARAKMWPRRVGNDGLARIQIMGADDPGDAPPAIPPDESPPDPPPGPPLGERLAASEARADALAAQVADLQRERDRLLTLLENRPAPGLWFRLFGR